MRVLLYVVGGVVLLGIIVTGVGYALPQEHVASVTGQIQHPPAAVFARITEVARYPEWRPDVKKVEVISTTPLTWREHSGGDRITYQLVEQIQPERIVTRIADPLLPFGGTWTYELRPDGTGTRVTITERGEVYNPVFRFMSRFIFGHTSTMERVLERLGS